MRPTGAVTETATIRRTCAALAGTLVLVFAVVAGAAPPRPGQGSFEVPAPRVGTVEVPAEHGVKGSPTRALRFERYCRKDSAKRPMVVLHGGPGEPMPMGKILASPFGDVVLRHFDLVYFDQRGAGQSLTAAEKDRAQVIRARRHYQTRQYIADVETLRQKLFGGRKVTIMGSSWGGFLGIAYAIAHPRAVEALILGSFAATGRYAVEFCSTFERTLLRAAAHDAKLRRALSAFEQAIGGSKIVWRRGSKQERPLRLPDVVEVVLPFAMKARFAQLTQVLQLILEGKPEGMRFLDQLDLERGETATAGGSLPGEATFCGAFLDRAALLALERDPPPATYCDHRQVARAFLQLCAPYFARDQLFDVEQDLPRVTVPALIFAGQWDPVLDWRSTWRLAHQLPNATFVLIDGGHTPVDAGGICLGAAVGAFVTDRRKMDLGCFMAHWP